jgi:hypothetical protein
VPASADLSCSRVVHQSPNRGVLRDARNSKQDQPGSASRPSRRQCPASPGDIGPQRGLESRASRVEFKRHPTGAVYTMHRSIPWSSLSAERRVYRSNVHSRSTSPARPTVLSSDCYSVTSHSPFTRYSTHHSLPDRLSLTLSLSHDYSLLAHVSLIWLCRLIVEVR